MKTSVCTCVTVPCWIIAGVRKVSDTFLEKIKACILCTITFFLFSKIISSRATDIHSEYVVRIAFLRRQRLRGCASLFSMIKWPLLFQTHPRLTFILRHIFITYILQYFFQSLPVHMIYCKTQASIKERQHSIPFNLFIHSVRTPMSGIGSWFYPCHQSVT